MLARYRYSMSGLSAPVTGSSSSIPGDSIAAIQIVRTDPPDMLTSLDSACRASGLIVDKAPSADNKKPHGWLRGVRDLVAHRGFEPLISSLRGRCPRPLDECAMHSC